eukprot:CAMPEP_0202867988 /NCGR_PEP_ID=MMETSP1391-20130828/9938_1 /ASSEMBLY_ACC=CAM_ASM_000867 /TAXON_ID=1034604 /ORGANISM="Chlamydomonas leiostraca, Strain SAG 11-49" /LENGTH=30 /DNA_ID= /DNA_START= /DNA_END= /DNA_ORIENTATION=
MCCLTLALQLHMLLGWLLVVHRDACFHAAV